MMPGLLLACREGVALAITLAGAAVEVAVAESHQKAVAGIHFSFAKTALGTREWCILWGSGLYFQAPPRGLHEVPPSRPQKVVSSQ